MTHDPVPDHESITTTHESWWVHDYCLLFSALCSDVQSGILDMVYSVYIQ